MTDPTSDLPPADEAPRPGPGEPGFDLDADVAAFCAALDARPRGARPPKIRYSHKAMADMLLTCPGISQNALAAAFGYTPAWVSTVITSDAFQSYLAVRRAEIVDPILTATVQDRIKGLTMRAVEVLQDKLAAPSEAISDQLALRAAEFGAKAMGLGGNAIPPPAPNPAEYLPQLAARIMRLQGGYVPEPAEDAKIIQ